MLLFLLSSDPLYAMDSDEDDRVTHVVTPEEILEKGLEVARYDEKKLNRCHANTNKKRFKSTYGVSAGTMCRIYEDLQKTEGEMCLKGSEIHLKWFLRTVFYLRKYPTEDDFERELNLNKGWGSTKIWETMKKIQHLKHKKVVWPDELGADEVWVLTVDGTHVWVYEPGHPEFSQDSEYFSHKFNKSGINYELGIAVATQSLIWMNGPFKAGKSDLQIFLGAGLRDRLSQLGKKAIGDGIYRGNQDTISYPNTHDSRPVKKFKSRALKRHEAFNGMTKSFQILRQAFRHNVEEKIGIAFEAVAVICQYKIEVEEPLYDILIEDVFKEEYSDSEIESYYSDGNSDEENSEEDNDDDNNYAMIEYADIAENAQEQDLADFLRSPILKTITFPLGKDRRKKIHRIIDEQFSHSRSKLRHESEGNDKARVLIITKLSPQQDDDDDDDDDDY